MLVIQEEILEKMREIFVSGKEEQGFLLGSESCLNQLDRCYQIPAVQAGIYFFTPDVSAADSMVRNWARQGICFSGFIHSHIVEKNDLSVPDIEFAKKLFRAYELPVLWFGLALVKKNTVEFKFYAVEQCGENDIKLTQVCFATVKESQINNYAEEEGK